MSDVCKETLVGRFVVRKDHSHTQGGAGPPVGLSAESSRRVEPGIVDRLARLVGDAERVLIFSRDPACLAQALETSGCGTLDGSVGVEGRRPVLAIEDESGAGRFDAIIVADLLGRIDDPRTVLRALKTQIRPGGSLIVSLQGIAPIGGRLAIVDDGPLGDGSGVLFTEDGLLGLLEAAEYVIGHVERQGPAVGTDRDCLIVAHPLPVPGLDFLQRRMRALLEQARNAGREAEELRERAAVADRRLEVLSGNEKRMAERNHDLRARLLAAHAEMIRRDDEIRKTFGDAIYHRNVLLIERDTLIAQREALLAERTALVAERTVLLEERAALSRSLQSANLRLNVFRMSPLGLAYRALRKLTSSASKARRILSIKVGR